MGAEEQTDLSQGKTETFGAELGRLINRFSMENGSDTPDYILAKYLLACLNAYNEATQQKYKYNSVERV